MVAKADAPQEAPDGGADAAEEAPEGGSDAAKDGAAPSPDARGTDAPARDVRGPDARGPDAPGAVVLVGVGHVFDLRDALRELVRDRRPAAVLVELDRRRYAALRQEQDAGGSGGPGDAPRGPGGLYGILSRFQRKAARALGTVPGEEMLAAVDAAAEFGAQPALIDMDAQVAFRRMWKAMGFREKLRFLWAALTGLFASEERISDEVEDIASGDYGDLMAAFAEEFPSAKRVLIDERNETMAERVRGAARRYPRTVVVVGDGHVEGMEELLADLDLEVVRLRQMVERAEALKAGGGAAGGGPVVAGDADASGRSVGFRVTYGSADDEEE